MSVTVKMDSPFMVLRGWPADGALDQAVSIAPGQTLSGGDVVVLNAAGEVALAGAAGAANAHCGFVVNGNGDDASAKVTKKALILWGNFIARTQKVAAGTYTPGDALMVDNGVIAKWTTGNPVVGYVSKVHAAIAGGDPLNLEIVVR